MSEKRGRPLKASTPLSYEVKVRVTEAELVWLRSRAASRGLPVSTILRRALLRYRRRFDPAADTLFDIK